MSLSSFKGFGVPHSSSRRKINRAKRIRQKDSGSDIGGSGSTQRGNGSNDESGLGDSDSRSEKGDRAVPLHLQNQRELRHVHDPEKHRAEWIQGSAINPELSALNMVSLEGDAPYERLFYSDSIKRLNSGRVPAWILKKYSHIEQGGWWASGIDPLTGEDELWGCFKPDKPRIDLPKGKYQKYEHPLKATATLFALKVPQSIWEEVSRRYGIPVLPTDIKPAKADNGFWEWVISNPQVSIILTEGVKKAAALLSQGYAAIGLPGIWGGYRRNDGKPSPSLLPQLQVFATGARQFYFAFDQDEKRKTRHANRKALWCTAKLLQDEGCKAFIIAWEPWIKGCDDLIVAKGGNHFTKCYSKALTFEDWQADGLKELTHKPALRLDSSTKYIGEFFPPPSARLVCLKAPKGSGKTEWLVKICAEAQSCGQKVLILTHRTQLGKALCDRFGIDYVDELGESTTKGVFGIGLCFDSLRQDSKSRFDPEDWHGCIVILDECEQSIWHLLNAKTEVAKYRVKILQNFRQLVQNVLESEDGRIYMSDADLSDLSIDYIRSLASFAIEPWIVVKEGNPNPWDVTVWEDCKEMLGILESRIRRGEKVLIFVDGQKIKSKWGTQNLEAYLLKEFPDLKILRVDAESVSTPGHPAYDCIDKLDNTLKGFDVCVASPTIETGVSIDLKGHFTSVWDFAQGVIPVPSVLQRMARLREPVPRHVWAKGYGLERIGNGSTSPKRLMAGQGTKFKAHIKQLAESDIDFDFDSAANNFQPQAIRTWVKMAARINSGMIRYQHEVIRALVAEGHHIFAGDYLAEMKEDDQMKGTEQVKEELTETRDKNYQQQCYAIAEASTPNSDKLKALQQKKAKSLPERLEQRKGELSERYDESLVNSELIELDDKGEFSKAQLHYYLMEGQEFLCDREKGRMKRLLESGENELFAPDVNRSMIGGKVAYLKALGVPELFSNVEWSNESKVLINLSIKTEQFQQSIKDVLGLSFNFNRIGGDGKPLRPSPVSIGQKYLKECLGLKFSDPVKKGAKGRQVRYYQPVEIPELRQKTLLVWRQRDEQRRDAKLAESSATTQRSNGGNGSVREENVSSYDTVSSTGNNIYTEVAAYQSAEYQSAAYQDGAVEGCSQETVEPMTAAESSATTQRSNGGNWGVREENVSSYDTVSSTGNNIYTEVAAYQSAGYQSAAYQGEVPTEELTATEQIADVLQYCDSASNLALIIEGFEATREQIEDVIALQDTQPQRQQLENWYRQLPPAFIGSSSELAPDWQARSPAEWEQKAETYGQLLVEGFERGIHFIRELLTPWSEDERWLAFKVFGDLAPEKLKKLSQIAPNWTDLCSVAAT
jgi:hypothetical protein